MTIGLDDQLAALEHAVRLAGDQMPDNARVEAKQALRTFAWLTRHAELIRQVNGFATDAPEMAEAMRIFDGAQLNIKGI